jgi:hypothetical protein
MQGGAQCMSNSGTASAHVVLERQIKIKWHVPNARHIADTLSHTSSRITPCLIFSSLSVAHILPGSHFPA